MTTATRPALPCARCHARQLVLAPGDGRSHWITCTNPERFKKYKEAHRRKAEGATQLPLEVP